MCTHAHTVEIAGLASLGSLERSVITDWKKPAVHRKSGETHRMERDATAYFDRGTRSVTRARTHAHTLRSSLSLSPSLVAVSYRDSLLACMRGTSAFKHIRLAFCPAAVPTWENSVLAGKKGNLEIRQRTKRRTRRGGVFRGRRAFVGCLRGWGMRSGSDTPQRNERKGTLRTNINPDSGL